MVDWLSMLDGLSRGAISHACETYMRNQPRRRPTPGDIRAIASSFKREAATSNKREGLSRDELMILDQQILPTARRWLGIPGLADQGRQILRYWGEQETAR